MPLEDADDLDSFFDFDDDGQTAVINRPLDEDYEVTIPVVLDRAGEAVAVYGDTNVEAPRPQFRCKTSDLATVRRRDVATIASRAYVIERMEPIRDGAMSMVYLSE